MCEYIPAAHYLPHQPPMVLIERVLHVDAESVCCQVTVSTEGPLAPFLNSDGQLPAWFGVEIMAQTIGVWSGWQGKQTDQSEPKPGMLLGGRGYRAVQPVFPANAQLNVTLRLLMRDEKLGCFEGEIMHDGEVLASGRLNTYQPGNEELQQLMSQGKQP